MHNRRLIRRRGCRA